jgi:hypothetical protein
MFLAVFVFIALWPGDRLVLAASLAVSPALAHALIMGQDDPFLLLVLLVGLRFLWKDRHFAAGIIFALCAAKFHLFLLLPILIIERRLWRVAQGAGAMLCVLVLTSFAVGGRHWIIDYIRVLRDQRIDPFPTRKPNLSAFLFGFPAPVWWIAAAAALVLCWFIIRYGSLTVGLAAVILGGILIPAHTSYADTVLLIPAFLALFAWSKADGLRYLLVLILSPVIYLLPREAFTAVSLSILTLTAFEVWQRARHKDLTVASKHCLDAPGAAHVFP